MEDKTWDLIKDLDDDFTFHRLVPKECTVKLDDVEIIENKFGVKFPDEYKTHILGKIPGLILEVNENVWPRPKKNDIGPFWSFLYCIHTFSASNECADWLRLDYAGKQFIDETGIKAIPILEIIGDENVYCVDKDGKIVQYDHEQNTVKEIKLTFWKLFEREINELKKRKEMKIKTNKK
jgi:hypothetical protein